jgi:hypothetical protein
MESIALNRIENKLFVEKKPTLANANTDGSDNKENGQLKRRVEIIMEIPEMADLYISL